MSDHNTQEMIAVMNANAVEDEDVAATANSMVQRAELAVANAASKSRLHLAVAKSGLVSAQYCAEKAMIDAETARKKLHAFKTYLAAYEVAKTEHEMALRHPE